MRKTRDGWIQAYQEKGALWIHDGNPKRPHALLTSGKHSNGFFNSRLVIEDDFLLCEAAADLIELFAQSGGSVVHTEGVVGPQTGATKLARFLSDQVDADTRRGCFWTSPAKGDGVMTFTDEELKLVTGSLILLCEDVISTGGSVELTADAVSNADGLLWLFVLTLVNRSGLTEINGKKIVALIDHPMPMWTPEECLEHQLCKVGSKAVRPKDNWASLTMPY